MRREEVAGETDILRLVALPELSICLEQIRPQHTGIIFAVMKLTLNWLKQYVDFDWSPEQLAERLTMLGLEVEHMQKVSGAFEGIVVAQILTKDKVPGSDKLSVCKVN